MARRTRPPSRHLLGTGLLALAAAALLTLPGVALAVTPPPGSPDSDGDCDTVPTSYPSNGEPVPLSAACELVITPVGTTVAEVWSWGDGTGLHWYNYLSEGYTAESGDALTMCATRDDSAAGVEYVCTTDSYYLLFTMSNLFVTWPSDADADLYYCESVEVVGFDGAPATGHACGTLYSDSEGAPGPPTSTPPPADPTQPVTSAPTQPPTTPADPESDEPEETDEPTAAPTTAPQATTSAPAVAETTGPSLDNPRELPENAIDPAPAQTPVDSESVAMVEGGAFPVGFVVAVAGALAIGGIAVLAGPGAIAARRRRT